MKISIVTDEISSDLETALELAAGMDVRDIELRGYGSRRVPLFTDYQKQRVKELLEEYNARVVAISPGLFKIPFPPPKRESFPVQVFDSGLFERWRDARSLVRYHLDELLPASIEYAREIGAQKVICFGFDRGGAPAGPAPDEVLEALSSAAGEAALNDLDLLIEVEAGFWADSGERTAELVRKIGRPALGINWDPGNSIETGELPYPVGYQAARKYIRHVHFKDVVRGEVGNFRYEINGEIDWGGQVNALVRDGYQGYISVEPHMTPKVSCVRMLCNRLKELIAAATAIHS